MVEGFETGNEHFGIEVTGHATYRQSAAVLKAHATRSTIAILLRSLPTSGAPASVL